MFSFKIEPKISFIYDQLINHGYEAYYVGGCVRDTLMNITPHDYDITTSALPEEIMACFDQRFKIIPTGLKHGTITVLYQNQTVEITTYRTQEVYENHRAPSSLTFTHSLSEDLKRRDFTINAMAYSPIYGLIDEHQGTSDLKAKLIRCVGDPLERFKEDALRILRCVRFAHRFGFSIENNTKNALIYSRHYLPYISIERITNEFFSMLVDGKPDLLLMMNELKLLDYLIPQYKDLNDNEIRKLSFLLDQTPNKLTLKLAVLLSSLNNDAETILKQWKTSNQLSYYVSSLINHCKVELKSEYAFKKCLYVHQNDIEWMKDLLLMKQILDYETPLDLDYLQQLIHEGLFERTQLAIDGEDCIHLGMQGKAIGECLNLLIDAILKNELKNERTALIQYITNLKK